MKRIIIFLAVLTFSTAKAQIKKTGLNTKVKIHKVNQGVKIKNIKDLSIKELAAKNIPLVSITEEQRNARPLTSWKIEPNRPKDNWLSVKSFYGWLRSDTWRIESIPFREGSQSVRWIPGWLDLNFRQSKGIEYRLKVKIQGSYHRGKSLYVQLDEMAGRYPVNPDGTIHVVWTSTLSSHIGVISIGRLLSNDYPQGFPQTVVEYVSIDKI